MINQCTNCGRREYSSRAVYCTSCGSRLISPKRSARSRGRGRLPVGMLFAFTALALFLWISRHSPHIPFAERMATALTDRNAYFIKEPLYSQIMLCAASLGLAGVVLIVRGLIREAKG
jgi:hypothetical protein